MARVTNTHDVECKKCGAKGEVEWAGKRFEQVEVEWTCKECEHQETIVCVLLSCVTE